MKNTHGGVLFLVKLQVVACNFTKSNSSSWVFFTFFKLYQIAQRITYNCKSPASFLVVEFLSDLRENYPNTEFFSVLHVPVCSPNTRKYRAEKTPYLGTFHAVTRH